jgi:stalled ribosome alternative rescue factor ArfA
MKQRRTGLPPPARRNAVARSLATGIYRQRIVPARKGGASYSRKGKKGWTLGADAPFSLRAGRWVFAFCFMPGGGAQFPLNP